MMFGRTRALAASLLLGLFLAPAQAAAEPAPTEAKPAAGAPLAKPAPGAAETLSMLNSLGHAWAWRSYKARFVTDQGRVVDTANGRISHSESQGYGMLLAVAAGD